MVGLSPVEINELGLFYTVMILIINRLQYIVIKQETIALLWDCAIVSVLTQSRINALTQFYVVHDLFSPACGVIHKSLQIKTK